MQKWGIWWLLACVLLGSVFAVATISSPVFAETASSSHYQLSESSFNTGTSLNSCSSSYCSRITIGDLSPGDSSSTNNAATFGSVTPDQPSLDVIVEPGVSNLGLLDAEHVASKTMVVKVRSYLSNGYIMQINGSPPKYNGRALTTYSSPRAVQAGKEMFGINVVKNTSPNVGADPLQVPSGDVSFGQARQGYNIPNQFKYVSGDPVAYSPKASGETDFTISMVVAISNTTPAGNYASDFSVIVIPVY